MTSFSLKRTLLTAALTSAVLFGSVVATSFADTLNFYNGHVVDGNIKSVIGDIIQYQDGLGKKASARRMTLTNRQDVIRTHAGKIYTGEVLYRDGYSTEIRTPTGNHKVWNGWVREMVMGAPLNRQETGMIEAPDQLYHGPQTDYDANIPSLRTKSGTTRKYVGRNPRKYVGRYEGKAPNTQMNAGQPGSFRYKQYSGRYGNSTKPVVDFPDYTQENAF